MKCIRCGKEMRNTIGGNYVCDSCGFAINDSLYRGAVPPNNNFWAQQGWICPKCGAVLSPSTTFCPFCAPKNNNLTAIGDKITYDIDYTHHNSTTTGQYINPNINTTISGGENKI